MKSVAIIGAGPTKDLAWDTPADEVWSFNHVAMYLDHVDLVIDIHEEDAIREKSLGPEIDKYWAWLQQEHDFPILMQERDRRFPSSVKFPKEEIKELLPDRPMASSLDWAYGLAYLRGATDIYLYGCTFGSDTEYLYQVGGNHYWMGVLEGKGVRVHIPTGDNLFVQQKDYGYEAWVRVDLDTMKADLARLTHEQLAKGHDADEHALFRGAVDALTVLVGWGESIGRQALERLKGDVWKNVFGHIALYEAGHKDAYQKVLEDEGRLCVLLHYMRVCDMLPSTLEIKRIDMTTPKPFGVV